MKYYGSGRYDPHNYGKQAMYMPGASIPTITDQQMQQNSSRFIYPQNLQEALAMIQQATTGETKDRLFYSWLIENAPSDEDKQIIMGIRDNEIGHYALFNQLYYQITGNRIPQLQGEQFTPPASYCEGLAQALQGEQNAVKNYRNILYAMQAREHINMMTEIITDEIRHGILYNYLYAKNGCRG